MNFSLAEIEQATNGRLYAGDRRRPVTKICTDTRILNAGEVFLAIQGKNFDGNLFIKEALLKGAAGVIATGDPEGWTLPEDCFYIRVEDGLVALGAIAREWRRVVDPTVCALTGSAGKTTTKEMIAYICRDSFRTLATEGNFNNRIGLPLTLLRLQEEHEVAIIETGMNVPGELTLLAGIAIPDIAVITNIGNAHIGNFGSVEKLIRAKAELFEAMPKDGTAIINADCPHASMMAEAFDIPSMVISYGQNAKADVEALNVKLTEPYGYEFDLRVLDTCRPVHLNVFGRFQVSNALAAAAASAAIGVPPELIAERLSTFTPPNMRAEMRWFDGVLIIEDCYNASPDAMMTSLRSLNDIQGLNERYAVLGDMYELGELAEHYHRRVGEAVAEAHIDFLCTIGNHSGYIREEAENRGIAAKHFEDCDAVAEFLNRRLKKNDALLVKGSRMLALEKALLRFRELRSAVQSGEALPVTPEGTH